MFNFYKLGKKQYYFQDKKRVNITRESFLKDEYWNLKNLIDPDGKKRNLITEKKKN